jgi:hypothetical protein
MMKTMIKTAGAASLLAMAVAGASAVAAPLAELGFSQHAGFDTPTFFGSSLQYKPASDVVNTDPLAPAGTLTSFAWEGANDPVESSIAIVSYNNSTAPTADLDGTPLRYTADFLGVDGDGQWNAGDWWVIDTITQTNNTLTTLGGAVVDPLWVVDTLANLRIYADAARTDLAYADPTTTNSIRFNETLNTTSAGEEGCAGLNPLQTICDDIFTASSDAFAPVSFTRDGYLYELAFALLPGTSTNNGVPAGTSLVVENDDGTITVYTPEFNPGTSSIHIAMSYTATLIPVPEPSVLGLFGAGMLALGFAGRRRKKA